MSERPSRPTGKFVALRSLGQDPVLEGVRRLRALCLVIGAVVPCLLTVVVAVAPRGAPQRTQFPTMLAIYGAGALLSVAMFLVTRREHISAQKRLDIGLVYFVLIAATIALFRHWQPWPAGDGFREVSPLALWILLYASIVPNEPRKTVTAALLAAAMDPLGLALAAVRGIPMPPFGQAVGICLSTFFAAGATFAIARVLYGLARSAENARRMGSYELVSVLGRGGMGEVWHAEHRLLARPAAVKLIRPEALGVLASEPGKKEGARARFEREAQATALLKSPHTVALYDFGVTDDGVFYYVMELLDGIDLENLVTLHGKLPPARVVQILEQACRSLEEAHQLGLIHRDIKPANIYVCRLGRQVDFVKILDFGLVKWNAQAVSPSTPRLTAEDTVTGTPAYLAPEMALGDRPIDARADLYGLGCVAYFMLTGHLVFEAETPMKLVIEHVRSTPIPPSKRANVDLPAALEALVLQCLAKEPDERPQSASDLRRSLGALGLADGWSGDTAAAWWEEHLPKRVSLPPPKTSN